MLNVIVSVVTRMLFFILAFVTCGCYCAICGNKMVLCHVIRVDAWDMSPNLSLRCPKCYLGWVKDEIPEV